MAELVRAGSTYAMLPSSPLGLSSHGVGKKGAQALLVWLSPFRAAFLGFLQTQEEVSVLWGYS